VVGDGSIKDLKLVVDETKLQAIDKAALIVITGIEKKKKIKISFNKSRRSWNKIIFNFSKFYK